MNIKSVSLYSLATVVTLLLFLWCIYGFYDLFFVHGFNYNPYTDPVSPFQMLLSGLFMLVITGYLLKLSVENLWYEIRFSK